MTEWQDHSQTSSPSLAWPGITKVALCLHFLWAYTILLSSTLQNSLVTDEIPCRDDRTLCRSSHCTLPGERCTLQRARVCQKTAELLTDIFMLQMMLGSDMLNKKNCDLWTELSFAFSMAFHLSPRNFYLKSFPCCTTGIPAQQRHFVGHVQSNNQSTKPMTEEEVKWRYLVCWHHGRPLSPAELCKDRSCFVKIGVLAHTHACTVLVGPALLQDVSSSSVCRSSARHGSVAFLIVLFLTPCLTWAFWGC